MILYHGSTGSKENPEIRPYSAGRDFGTGFYCTNIRTQAEKWAFREARLRKQAAILYLYEFDIDDVQINLNMKTLPNFSQEWMELVINCRKNFQYDHGYDIVCGRIANDDIGETVQTVLEGFIPLDTALRKLEYMSSQNQYCFCTERSLEKLSLIQCIELE